MLDSHFPEKLGQVKNKLCNNQLGSGTCKGLLVRGVLQSLRVLFNSVFSLVPYYIKV